MSLLPVPDTERERRLEICVICWWEDDGQNDYDANEVRGGPNSQYSLTVARRNFAEHGHMYDRGQGLQVVEQPSGARRELMNYLRSINFCPQRADAKRLGELLDAEEINRYEHWPVNEGPLRAE